MLILQDLASFRMLDSSIMLPRDLLCFVVNGLPPIRPANYESTTAEYLWSVLSVQVPQSPLFSSLPPATITSSYRPLSIAI